MKIVKLQSENVKRLRAVEIEPNGNVVQIRGKNGQGKSSVLDSIVYALGGKGAQPPQVIHAGETQARVVLELDDLVVERRWTSNENSYLEVRSRDGEKRRSPQTILDELVGRLTFDPLAFLNEQPAKQLELLRQLTGVDLSDLEAQRKAAYDKRTLINREVERLKGKVDAMPAALAGTPDAEVSAGELLERQAQLMAQREANERVRAEARGARRQVEATQQAVTSSEERVKRLEEQLAAAKAEVAKARSALQMAQDAMMAADADEADLLDPDFAQVQEQLKNLEATNAAVRAKRERAARADELRAKQAESEGLTQAIAEVDAEKEKRVAEAKMPVPGLGFGADGITLGGLAFSQASQAERLRVAVAMGLALNPKLRVLLVREASLLDEDNLALVSKMAAEADAQVWLEVVGQGGSGILIEDGQVAEVSA